MPYGWLSSLEVLWQCPYACIEFPFGAHDTRMIVFEIFFDQFQSIISMWFPAS